MRIWFCCFALLSLLSCRRTKADPLRLGFFPNLTHAQALVGNAEGTFHQALGDKPLEMKQFNAGPAAMEALLAGSLDACYVGTGPAITANARAKGVLHIVAGAASGGAVFVVKNVKSAADLRGKRVASPQLGNSQDIALRTWLKAQGLKIGAGPGLEKGAVVVSPLASSDILGLFKRGQLAGAWVPEPWGARLVHEAGGRILVDERDLWPGHGFPTTVLVVSQRALSTRRDELKALLRAHLALTARARQDPVRFAAQANQAFGALTTHPLTEKVLADAFSRIEFTPDVLTAQLQVAAQHAADLKFIPSADISGLVDSSLLNEIVEASR